MGNLKINTYTLKNGLKIVHTDSVKTSLVTTNVLYNVGSIDEDEEHTGIAHLMEHLMFSGSQNAPSYDEPLEEAGAQNNAWTNNDETNFYVTIHPSNIEILLFLESDRMAKLTLSDNAIEVQKKVVIEEMKERVLNKPYGDKDKCMRSLAYKRHHYRWPTIGLSAEHIQDTTKQYLRDFYESRYAPNNAVLSVVGNIHADRVLELAEKWFDDVESREVKPRNLETEPMQTESRIMEVERNVPHNNITIAFHIPSILDDRFPLYNTVTDFLAEGESSRLKKMVRETGKFLDADSYVQDMQDNGLLILEAYMKEGTTYEEAETLLMDEVKRIAEDATEREMQKLLNIKEVNYEMSIMSSQSVAYNIAKSYMLDRPDLFLNEIDRYRNLKLSKIKDVAMELSAAPRNVLRYKAKK